MKISDIQRIVAEHFGLPLIDMTSARRAQAIARPRQVAMYLARFYTGHSLPEIGRRFGGRDHTTVMHAIKVIGDLRQHDRSIAEALAALEKKLREHATEADRIATLATALPELTDEQRRRAIWHRKAP